MTPHHLPPGAWLSGALGALQPTEPPRAANGPWQPTEPPRAATGPWKPTEPPRAAQQVSAAPMPSAAPFPWDGLDPHWVYHGADSLLAQALRRTRARILRASETRLPAAAIAEAARLGQPLQGSHLMRWASSYRIKAISAELAGRFQVLDKTVWMIDPGSPGLKAPACQATAVFALPEALSGERLLGDQIDHVLRAAVEREDRLPEILSQSADFWPFFESFVGFRLDQAPRTGELLEVAFECLGLVLMALKNAVGARRPFQASTLVAPVIATPGHGALPSGHAAMAALSAELLHLLLYRNDKEATGRLDRLARRIAYNRVVAGVHFPADSQAGYLLGLQFARLMAALADRRQPVPAELRADQVFAQGHELPEDGPRPALVAGKYKRTPAPNLAFLWQQAQSELDALRV